MCQANLSPLMTLNLAVVTIADTRFQSQTSSYIIYYFKHSSFMQPFMPQSINWITLHLGVLVLKNKCAVGTAFKSFRARQTNRTCIAMVLNSNADVFDFPLSTNLLQNLSVRLCLVFPKWKDGSLDSRFRKKRK